MCKKKKYDYVFMDVNMPVMNGYEAADLISKLEKNIYLIAVTGNDEETEKAKCLKHGFDAFLSKPVEFNTVMQIINH